MDNNIIYFILKSMVKLFSRFVLFLLVEASYGNIKTPEGFELVDSGLGVSLYEKDLDDGRITAQVLYLNKGARLDPHLHFSNANEVQDGVPSDLEHFTAQDIYQQERQNRKGIYSVINGLEFSDYDLDVRNSDCLFRSLNSDEAYMRTVLLNPFATSAHYTGLAAEKIKRGSCDVTANLTNPVYVDGVIHEGQQQLTYDVNGMLLSINYKDGIALVHDLEHVTCRSDNCFDNDFDEIIGDLNKTNKNVDHYIPGKFINLNEDTWEKDKSADNRTALGVVDSDNDGIGDAILVLVAESISIVGLAEIFKDFGVVGTPCTDEYCSHMHALMLDSGSSSQVYFEVEDTTSIPSDKDRPVPMTIVISEGLEVSDFLHESTFGYKALHALDSLNHINSWLKGDFSVNDPITLDGFMNVVQRLMYNDNAEYEAIYSAYDASNGSEFLKRSEAATILKEVIFDKTWLTQSLFDENVVVIPTGWTRDSFVLKSNCITNGRGNGYEPNELITKAESAIMILRVSGLTHPNDNYLEKFAPSCS